VIEIILYNQIDIKSISLPFKGRAGVGMGEMQALPIPHLTSPLKGEELGRITCRG
jgi:hypothetical protein